MATAIHLARTSPPRLPPLHPPLHPHPSLSLNQASMPLAPHPSDGKYLLFPGQQFHMPTFPIPTSHPMHHPTPFDEDDFEEDVDEDDISDFEEELQRELLACRSMQQRQPDMTQQLLAFADMVNADIQKFFGRKKGDEDSCDVYEDKWVVTKSGRELYYADLLRIAQGDYGDSKTSKATSGASLIQSSAACSSKDLEVAEDNRHTFSGKVNLDMGLGPLNDLFDYGLKTCFKDGKPRGAVQENMVKRHKPDQENNYSEVVPMHQRRLPSSFWREPGITACSTDSSRVGGVIDPVNDSNMGVPILLSSAKLPDFSDLMENWHAGGDHHPHQQIHHFTPQQLQQLHNFNHHHRLHRESLSARSETNPNISSDPSSQRL